MDRLIARLYEEWRPNEGWLPLALMVAIASTIITTVLEADWVPEARVVVWTVILGLFLSISLAKRPISRLLAWFLFVGYGIVITLILLAQLWPPLRVISDGIGSTLTYIRQNIVLFGDRAAGWLEAVANQESSEETIVFALGLGLISWLLIAYLGWTTYRNHNPLNGLILVGLALGFNTLYGGTNVWTVAVFIGLAVLLTAAIHLVDMQQLWDRKWIDYPTGINVDLMMTSGGVALALLLFSFILPAVNIRAIREAILERPSVQEAEEALDRAFGGVNISRENLPGQELERRGGSGGSLPRSFLLGNPPELAETLVMTATVQGEEADEGANWPVHWRAYSYDIYTGRGWSVSNERQERFNSGEALPLPPVSSSRILTQSINWVLGETNTRYTVGLPLRFDHPVTAYWRGLSDLSQVRGRADNYAAESRVTNVAPAVLREAVIADVPDAILARYTALPEDVPGRVLELAQEAAGEAVTIYDRVKAIERFLRQYPYTLDVTLPPSNQDLVDYFLFDLQMGYCDYYASSMVVMARSLGIPARFTTGFLAQPPDENGVQQIYQINAHSWAEVYFAGYGWVEFEPTAAFPTQSQVGLSPESEAAPPDFSEPEPIELPPSPEDGQSSILSNPYFLIVLAVFLAGIGVLIWLTIGRQVEPDLVLKVYGRLQRSANWMGQATPENQTPIEFDSAFRRRVNQLAKQSSLAGRLIHASPNPVKRYAGLTEETGQLTKIFMAHQYSRQDEEKDSRDVSQTAENIWRRIRLRLWLLTIFSKLKGFS